MSYPPTRITQQNMMRRYPQDNVQYANPIYKLQLGTKKMMADIHTILTNPITFYISNVTLRDQMQKMGAEIVGYADPHERPDVKEGEHFIAMKHPKIPVGNIVWKDLFEWRSTYSVDYHEWKYAIENYSDSNNSVDGLLQQQLAAWGRSIQIFMAFISYMIFHNPQRNKNSEPEKLDCTESENKNDQQSRKAKLKQVNVGSEYRKNYYSWAQPEFENFIEYEFNPTNASEKGYPIHNRVLALERLPILRSLTSQPVVKNSVNRLLVKIKDIRKKLRETKRIEYDEHDNRFYKNIDLNESVCDSLTLREKIMWTAKDMIYNGGEYMVDINTYGKFNPTVNPSDLVVIVSYKDIMNLKLGVPHTLEPKNWEFTPAELGVGRIIETKWLVEGDALILHKDLIRLDISELPIGRHEYPEQSTTNQWMDIMFYLETVDWWGCAYITKKSTPKPEPSSS